MIDENNAMTFMIQIHYHKGTGIELYKNKFNLK